MNIEKYGWERLESRIEMQVLQRANVEMYHEKLGYTGRRVGEGPGLFIEWTYGPAWALAIYRERSIQRDTFDPFKAEQELRRAATDMEYRLARLAVIELTCMAPAVTRLARISLSAGAEARRPG